MQEFLDKSERTDEPAYGSSEEHAQRQHKAQRVKAQAELSRAADCLHCADRACQPGRRARIAIDARVAEVLPASLVKPAAPEVADVAV